MVYGQFPEVPGMAVLQRCLFETNSLDLHIGQVIHANLLKMQVEQWNCFARNCTISETLDIWVYVEQLLSHLRRVQLSPESIIKIVRWPSLKRVEQTCFLSVVDYSETGSVEDKSQRDCDKYFPLQPWIDFFFHMKRKIRLGKRRLSHGVFRGWKTVSSVLRRNEHFWAGTKRGKQKGFNIGIWFVGVSHVPHFIFVFIYFFFITDQNY